MNMKKTKASKQGSGSKPSAKGLKGATKKAAKKTAKKALKRTAKKATPKVSSVKGKSVSWYMEQLEPEQQALVREIDQLIRAAAPTTTASIKWAQPVYETSDGPYAFIKAAKQHVTFGFWRGAELTDEQGLLEGDGVKMRHVKVRTKKDIKKAVFRKWIKQSVKLNQQSGSPTRSSK